MTHSQQAPGERFRVVSEAIRTSEGFRIESEISNHVVSYRILQGNFKELKEAAAAYKNPDFAVTLLDRRTNPGNADIIEATRLLHNFLAATKTLADHSDVLIKRMYAGSKLLDEYGKRLDELLNDKVISFVHNFRHYALHRGVPFTSATVTITNSGKGQETSSRLNLSIRELRSWNGWRSRAKSYLATLDDDAELEKIIDQYMAKIDSFYQWFWKRQEIEHERALTELRELRKEAKPIYEQLMAGVEAS